MNKEAYNYCIFLISKRDYSRYKLRAKLRSRKYSSCEIEEVILKLIEQKYLQEDQYIRMRIKSLAYKGVSNRYIQQKLQQEQLSVDDELIETLREENSIHIADEIPRLIEKKLRNKEIPADWTEKQKLKSKLINFLASKGYSYQAVLQHLPKEFSGK